MRSPFDVRVPKPKREGEATLLYPFDAGIAWVAACHHRTSSRISWDLFSSPAVRLEPLFEELLPALQADDRLPRGQPACASRSISGSAHDFEAVAAAAARRREERDRRGARGSRGRDGGGRCRRAGGRVRGRAAPAPPRAAAPSSGSTSASARGTAAARGSPPVRRRCAKRWRHSSSCCRGGTREPSRWSIRWPGGGTIPIEAAGLAVGAAIRRPRRPAVPAPGRLRRAAGRGAGSLPGHRAAHPRARHRRGADSHDGRQPSRGRPRPERPTSTRSSSGSRDVRTLTPEIVDRSAAASGGHEGGRVLLQSSVRRAHRRRGR